ncbi:hypothetical protein FOZ62_030182, partial [Perkinsus olseni]
SDLNDCYLPAWEVAARNESGPWGPVLGCDLASQQASCARECTARDLLPATQYEFRVRVVCYNVEANSTWSSPVVARTKPVPAPRPTMAVAEEGVTEVHVIWSRSTTGSCPASIDDEDGHLMWTVEARLVHDDTEAAGPWFTPIGCYSYRDLSCVATGLECDSLYEFRVRELCKDSEADSPWSARLEPARTQRGGSCVVRALPPSRVHATAINTTSIGITWQAALQTRSPDCTSLGYSIQMRSSNADAPWTPMGCGRDLLNVSTAASCVAVGLLSNTYYSFRAAYVCLEATVSSSYTDWTDPPTMTLPVPAERPINVTAATLSPGSLLVTWARQRLEDCNLSEWLVEGKVYPSDEVAWVRPSGCMNLLQSCVRSCLATDLGSNQGYIFRVRALCHDTKADSEFSEPSRNSTVVQVRTIDSTGSYTTRRARIKPAHTLPIRASTPLAVTASLVANFTDSRVRVAWLPTEANDCEFLAWSVTTRSDANPQPYEITRSTDPFASDVTVDSLACATSYSFSVARLCSLLEADSEASAYSSPVATTLGPECISKASAPVLVEAGPPTTEELVLLWDGGPRQCNSSFSTWLVALQTSSSSPLSIVPCAFPGDVIMRSSTSCILKDLLPDTSYRFRVREVCEDASESSPWSAPSDWVRTLPNLKTIWRLSLKQGGAIVTPLSSEVSAAELYTDHYCQELVGSIVVASSDPRDTAEYSFQQQYVEVRCIKLSLRDWPSVDSHFNAATDVDASLEYWDPTAGTGRLGAWSVAYLFRGIRSHGVFREGVLEGPTPPWTAPLGLPYFNTSAT